MDERICVMTAGGMVSGICSEGYVEFKGIPFARAGRFECPGPARWDGLLDGSSFGKKAVQAFGQTMPWEKPQTREEFDEDCLNLNVYVPEAFVVLPENDPSGSASAIRPAADDGSGEDAANGRGLPVLVEVHGGAFQGGSNQEHTPAQMIRDQRLIYVSVNYRLGVFGFLYLGCLENEGGKDAPELSGNLGMMDLMAAIRWIYENISAFGGDPEQITLMGSSAGAKAIGGLMCTPQLGRFVHRVILSSGATQSIRDKKTAGVITERFMGFLSALTGRKRLSFSDLKTLPADTLLEAQKRLCDHPGNTCMFGPVADGTFLPEDAAQIAARGTLWEGSAMIGSSMHELAFYKMMDPDFVHKAPEIADGLFGENFGIARRDFLRLREAAVKSGGGSLSQEQAADLWVRILTDYMYRTYSYRLAGRLAAKGSKVWQYSVAFLPALHCFDQQLAFSEPLPAFFNGREHMEKSKVLGRQIYESFVRFITTGRPDGGKAADGSASGTSWPCLTPEAPVQMVWDEESRICPVNKDEVLEGIGDTVYQL